MKDSDASAQAPQQSPEPSSVEPAERPPTWFEVVKSVGAAFFGVQSEANRRRDFTYGKLYPFVVVGIVATIVFILVLAGIVHVIVSRAGV